MGYVTGTDSRQMTLGVWSIEDEVPRDSPARFIEVFVDSLWWSQQDSNLWSRCASLARSTSQWSLRLGF